MNSRLFERFLDNLEIYFDVRKSLVSSEKIMYDLEYGSDQYWRVYSMVDENQNVVENQRDVLQMLFEKMLNNYEIEKDAED